MRPPLLPLFPCPRLYLNTFATRSLALTSFLSKAMFFFTTFRGTSSSVPSAPYLIESTQQWSKSSNPSSAYMLVVVSPSAISTPTMSLHASGTTFIPFTLTLSLPTATSSISSALSALKGMPPCHRPWPPFQTLAQNYDRPHGCQCRAVFEHVPGPSRYLPLHASPPYCHRRPSARLCLTPPRIWKLRSTLPG